MKCSAEPLHIAVAIPCYNAEGWINRTIESVLNQDYPHLSLIVVDDGSTDGSIEKIRGYEPDIIIETGPNRGACAARNRGHRIAVEQGADYILFLDADDYLERDMLRGSAQVAQETGADLVISNMHLEYADGTREERYLYSGHIPAEAFFEGWMEMNYVNPSAQLWRTGFVDKVGGWDESLARAQDIDIALRAMLEQPKPTVWKNEQGAAIHVQVNDTSISRNISRRATESRLRVQEKLLDRIGGTTFELYAPLLCREVYSIARSAFRTGEVDLGRRALTLLKTWNYRENPGTLAHRFAAGLLGLEAKVRLWGR